MRIAVIGNKEWQNKRKVQKVLSELKDKFSQELIIVSGGGSEGANHMVKKFALEFGISYEEYNPSYTGRNLYSMLPESYYGKKYHFSQLFHRMRILAENCDYMIILNNQNDMNPQLQKLKKPVVVLG